MKVVRQYISFHEQGLIFFLFFSFLLFFSAEGVFAQKKANQSSKQEKPESTIPLDNFYVEVKPTFRRFLKHFNFGISTGYGNTVVKHSLEGVGVHQIAGRAPTIFLGNKSDTVLYSNWINDFTPTSSSLSGEEYIDEGNKLGFIGNAFNIPLKLTLHYEFLEKFRIGGGISYESMKIGSLSPISYTDKIGDVKLKRSLGIMSKYFATIGFSFYRIGNYLFTGDMQFGSYKPGGNFNKSLISTSSFFNIGLVFERQFSENLNIFVRPSFEIKKYTISTPNKRVTINHNLNAFYINVGISYSIPELRRCFIKSCKSQHNHPHGNREYRSRVHSLFRIQNPRYGESLPLYYDPEKRKKSPKLKRKKK